MLTGLLVFLLLAVALLAIPLSFTFEVSWRQVFRSDIRLHWLFGLVRVHIPADRITPPSSTGEQREPRTDRSERSPRKKQNAFVVLRQRGFRRRLIRFVSDVWRAVQKNNVSLRVRVGLGDPADTGQLWAVLGPLAGVLTNVREASIRLEPEFLDTTLEMDSSGSVRIVPLQMIYLTVALLLSPPIWRGIRQMRTAAS